MRTVYALVELAEEKEDGEEGGGERRGTMEEGRRADEGEGVDNQHCYKGCSNDVPQAGI